LVDYSVQKKGAGISHELGFLIDDENVLINIAYHIFFHGIGNNSDKLILESLGVDINRMP
jgi:hypothetical protein